jgi:hypothetical protein
VTSIRSRRAKEVDVHYRDIAFANRLNSLDLQLMALTGSFRWNPFSNQGDKSSICYAKFPC